MNFESFQAMVSNDLRWNLACEVQDEVTLDVAISSPSAQQHANKQPATYLFSTPCIIFKHI